MKRLARGHIAVVQETVGRFKITYNPDDDRFYVQQEVTEKDCRPVVGTFTRLDNARGYAKKMLLRKTRYVVKRPKRLS